MINRKIISALILVIAGSTSALAQTGPVEWADNGNTYQFVFANVTWTGARAAAEASILPDGRAGHLVTITSVAENDFVANLVGGDFRAWIGLTDEVSEGSFQWVTGEALSYTRWSGGEPNNSGNEDYVELFASNDSWNDRRNTPFAAFNAAYVIEWEAVPAPDNIFSIAIIPDTQMYVERNPEIFLNAQMDWITAHQLDADKNIVYVAHLGDIKDDQFCNNNSITLDDLSVLTEWQIVRQAFDKLEAATSPGFPDGIPYGLVPGNHDFGQIFGSCPTFNIDILPRPLSVFNANFGPSSFDSTPGVPRAYYGGSRLPGDNDDNYTLFSAGGFDFIAINLGYRGDANALGSLAEITWADARLKEFPNRIGIITTHYVLDCNSTSPACGGSGFIPNNFGNWGAQLYSGVSGNSNLMMMLGAHRWGESWRVEDRSGAGMQPVQVLLSDYQRLNYPTGDPTSPATFSNISEPSDGFGDSGFMRLMTFDTVTGIVTTTTFSPADVAALVGSPPTATDLVSVYFPYAAELADGVLTGPEIATINAGTQMRPGTASNIRFSFLGYVP